MISFLNFSKFQIQKLKSLFKRDFFIMSLIVVFGFVLRVINLGSEPFWGDEVLSLGIVKHFQRIGDLIVYLQTVEIHPPLYYIMLHFWTALFGFSQAAVRSLSLIFGIGVIILTFLLAKKLFKDRFIALLSAFFVSSLPIQIEYSAEARPYIIFCFFGLASVLSFLKYRESKNKYFLSSYVIFNTIGIYLHYSYLFILVPLSLYWLFTIYFEKIRPREFIKWLIAHGLIFLLIYWWLQFFLLKIIFGQYEIFDLKRSVVPIRELEFIETTLIKSIWLSIEEQEILVNVAKPIEIFAAFLFKALFAGSIIYILIKLKDRAVEFLKEKKDAIIFSIWMIFAPIIIFLFSPASSPYTNIVERHIISVSIFIVVIFALVARLLDIKKRVLYIAIFLISIMNFTTFVIMDDSLWYYEFRLPQIANHIAENYKEGDIVLIYSAYSKSDLNYFLPSNISVIGYYPFSLIDEKYDFLGSRDTLGLVENESQLRYIPSSGELNQKADLKLNYIIKKENPKRIWLVFLGKERSIHDWLLVNRWKKSMDSLGPLMPVELYRKN